MVVVHQRFVALGFFDGVKVFALEVFDERELGHLAVIRLDDDGGHFGKTGDARGAPAALARDDLIVAGRKAADRQRLDNAVLADGIGQILQSLFIEVAARLIGVGFDLRDGEIEVVGRVGAQGGVAQQRAEPLAEPAVCICHGNFSFLWDEAGGMRPYI